MADQARGLKHRFFDNNGDPLGGGKLYTYIAGTTTNKVTYTDAAAGTPNANPIILDSNGYCDLFLGSGTYKFVLTDSADASVYTIDNISAPTVPDWGSVDTDILPDTSLTHDIGASGNEINNIYVDKIYGAENCGARSIDVTAGEMFDNGGTKTLDWTNSRLYQGSTEVANWSAGIFKMLGLKALMPTGTSDPSGTTAGEFYFNTSTSKLMIYTGAAWIGVTLS